MNNVIDVVVQRATRYLAGSHPAALRGIIFMPADQSRPFSAIAFDRIPERSVRSGRVPVDGGPHPRWLAFTALVGDDPFDASDDALIAAWVSMTGGPSKQHPYLINAGSLRRTGGSVP